MTATGAAPGTAPLELFVCDLRKVQPDALAGPRANWLDAGERARLSRFAQPGQALAFLAGRTLLRRLLAQALDCPPASLEFIPNPAGKLALRAPLAAPEFNLSHSHGFLAIAISRVGPVGIDIDSTDRRNRMEDLARRFCSPREQALLAGLPPQLWRLRFMEMWTLKEAFLKLRGRGMEWPLARFTGLPGERELELAHADHSLANCSAWLYRHWPRRPLACMLQGAVEAPRLWQVGPTGEAPHAVPARPLRWPHT